VRKLLPSIRLSANLSGRASSRKSLSPGISVTIPVLERLRIRGLDDHVLGSDPCPRNSCAWILWASGVRGAGHDVPDAEAGRLTSTGNMSVARFGTELARQMAGREAG
jgi:hypothetical protein